MIGHRISTCLLLLQVLNGYMSIRAKTLLSKCVLKLDVAIPGVLGWSTKRKLLFLEGVILMTLIFGAISPYFLVGYGALILVVVSLYQFYEKRKLRFVFDHPE